MTDFQLIMAVIVAICIAIFSSKKSNSITDFTSDVKPWDNESETPFLRRDYTSETPEQRQIRIDLHPSNKNLSDGEPKLDWDTINEDPETGWDFQWIREQRENGRNI